LSLLRLKNLKTEDSLLFKGIPSFIRDYKDFNYLMFEGFVLFFLSFQQDLSFHLLGLFKILSNSDFFVAPEIENDFFLKFFKIKNFQRKIQDEKFFDKEKVFRKNLEKKNYKKISFYLNPILKNLILNICP